MKVIRNVEELWEYINKIGVLSREFNVHTRQKILVEISDKIEKAAGGYPFRVQYHRNNGYFEVKPGAKGRAKSNAVIANYNFYRAESRGRVDPSKFNKKYSLI